MCYAIVIYYKVRQQQSCEHHDHDMNLPYARTAGVQHNQHDSYGHLYNKTIFLASTLMVQMAPNFQ